MNETQVTLQGWVGNDVTLRRAGETPVAHFRVAATPRRFSPASEEWSDAETQWFTVNAWRALGTHCAASLRRGDPVVIHGRLNARTWISSAGVEMSGFEVEATYVGHDLTRGTSSFTRAPRGTGSVPAPEAASADPVPAQGSAPTAA